MGQPLCFTQSFRAPGTFHLVAREVPNVLSTLPVYGKRARIVCRWCPSARPANSNHDFSHFINQNLFMWAINELQGKLKNVVRPHAQNKENTPVSVSAADSAIELVAKPIPQLATSFVSPLLSGSVSLTNYNSWALRQTKTKRVPYTHLVTQSNII